MAAPRIEIRIRLAGVLVALGLLVQLLTLIWNHPLSFMAFLLVGCPLMLLGVLLFLFSLVAGTNGAASAGPR
jgi:hypothetical protein